MRVRIGRVLPSWILPVVGIGGIIALFYFGYDQELSIRVTLGLAAAALASYIPGFLQIHSQTIKTGGAIAVLVVVMFAEDIGRAFAPTSKVPGVSSNVRLSRDQMQYQSEIASAQFEIWNDNYAGAIEILNHARKLNPSDQLALHMIGSLNFKMKKFTAAAEAFEQGYRVGGADKGRFAWNVALSHDAISETNLAKKWIETAFKDSSRNDYPELWHDVVYDRGLISMLAWLREGKRQRNQDFEIATGSFNAFLDHQPKVTHWADYHLACLHAMAAEVEDVKQPTQAKAVEHFDKFLHEIQGLVDGAKIKANREIAQRVLALNTSTREDKRGPLEPVECPAIKKAWDAVANRDWDTDVVAVFLPGNNQMPLKKT
jgi:tetratricopeptide (TPR) repeat protein